MLDFCEPFLRLLATAAMQQMRTCAQPTHDSAGFQLFQEIFAIHHILFRNRARA